MIRVSLKPLSKRHKRNNVAWIIGLIFILAYSVFINPAKFNISTCRFHQLTGLDCPTCGISRSFYAFSHFNLTDAFNYHIFGPVFFLISIFLLFFFMIEFIIKKEIKLYSPFINLKRFSSFLIGLWLAVWIFRILI